MRRKLNIGPGAKWVGDDTWMTLDYYHPEADLVLDLRELTRLPLPSNRLDKIYCSHVIEHLDDAAVRNLYRESFRVLRYGGIVRFSCPDAEKAIAQYRAGRCDPDNEVVSRDARNAPEHLRLLNVFASFRAPEYQGIRNTSDRKAYSGGPIASAEEVEARLNSADIAAFSAWAVSLIPDDATYRAHVNAHWRQKLLADLRRAGFADIVISGYRQSRDPELRGPDFDNRPTISVFVEARAISLGKRLRRSAQRVARRLRGSK